MGFRGMRVNFDIAHRPAYGVQEVVWIRGFEEIGFQQFKLRN
jgi:hypothetical protein